MSVVYRELNGREYLHVHRKVNKEEFNRFINITGLFGKELALKKHDAKTLDKELAARQTSSNQSVMSQFCHPNGRLKHIIIAPPQKKSGWAVKCVINQDKKVTFSKSLSVAKHTLEKAIVMMFEMVAEVFKLPKRSAMFLVLKSLYVSYLTDYFYKLKSDLRELAI
ncbi:hypothetical protein D5R81_14720 [Parashewanella spongiae]|uniref:Uncharacterized protein n=1 Tax=Parashewanella spongiae TaxID=342950 RepID=A0A3A6TRL3_9GAMM|nr:hypothetical protein [Parashewanella spongiae]MCL1079217.1 hypothetical protein [Parashewanella spongiae]RJY10439.1 hypothetical protein D5R81_14720 [Parashewanella spongiae]